MKKGGDMITVEAKKVGARVIATVKVAIGTGHHTYTVQFADQGTARVPCPIGSHMLSGIDKRKSLTLSPP
jgi:hypothetical protein